MVKEAMKYRGIKRFILKEVVQNFPDLTPTGQILYATPVNNILRGVEFAPGGGASFRVVLFVKPLYVPFPGGGLGYGYSIKKAWYSNEYWDDTSVIHHPQYLVAAIRKALRRIEPICGPLEFLKYADRAFPQHDRSVGALARGLSLAKINRYQEAEAMLGGLVESRPEMPRGIVATAEHALALMAAAPGPTSPIAFQLDNWERETLVHYRSIGCSIVTGEK